MISCIINSLPDNGSVSLGLLMLLGYIVSFPISVLYPKSKCFLTEPALVT